MGYTVSEKKYWRKLKSASLLFFSFFKILVIYVTDQLEKNFAKLFK